MTTMTLDEALTQLTEMDDAEGTKEALKVAMAWFAEKAVALPTDPDEIKQAVTVGWTIAHAVAVMMDLIEDVDGTLGTAKEAI